MKQYIMALDQGTTSSRCILFDKAGNICSMAQKEFTQIYPKPGWVEHNPMEIWSSQLAVATECMAMLGVGAEQISGIGITNQRDYDCLGQDYGRAGVQCHCLAVPPHVRYDRSSERGWV